MLKKLMPKSDEFFDDFDAQAEVTVRGAKLLLALFEDFTDIERKVARCRILLSTFAMAAAYLIPNNLVLMRWTGFGVNAHHIEPYALVVRRDDPDFRLVVNRTLVALYRSGDIDAIFYRWLGALGRPGPLLNSMFYLSTLPE